MLVVKQPPPCSSHHQTAPDNRRFMQKKKVSLWGVRSTMAFLPPSPGQGDNTSLPETAMDAGTVMDGNPHQRVLAVCYDLCQPSASLVYL